MSDKKYYKGFDSKLRCRDYQYETGKEYEESTAVLCNKGFHACECPLDTFAYYPPNDSRYCEVELGEVSDKRDTDTKRVGKKIKIGAEIGIPGIIKAHVEWVKDQVDWENAKETNTGYRSAAEVFGKDSVAIVTGCDSRVKGALGSAIVAVERAEWNGSTYPLIAIKAAIVDGDIIKPDTWYKVINGEFVAEDENE